jgi:hypothetical protein
MLPIGRAFWLQRAFWTFADMCWLCFKTGSTELSTGSTVLAVPLSVTTLIIKRGNPLVVLMMQLKHADSRERLGGTDSRPQQERLHAHVAVPPDVQGIKNAGQKVQKIPVNMRCPC